MQHTTEGSYHLREFFQNFHFFFFACLGNQPSFLISISLGNVWEQLSNVIYLDVYVVIYLDVYIEKFIYPWGNLKKKKKIFCSNEAFNVPDFPKCSFTK